MIKVFKNRKMQILIIIIISITAFYFFAQSTSMEIEGRWNEDPILIEIIFEEKLWFWEKQKMKNKISNEIYKITHQTGRRAEVKTVEEEVKEKLNDNVLGYPKPKADQVSIIPKN
ncbi:MAG: hypothetical protein ACOCV1_06965 [Bacillota bacterium]